MPLRLFNFVAALFLLAACKPGDATTVAPLSVEAWLPLAIGDVSLEAQVALSAGEQSRGLMYRESLPENGGMLFPYPKTRRMTFWMANTPLPLDIGFFDEHGVLLEVHRMYPFDTTRISSNSDKAQFALEMRQGWFSSKGLRPGARLDLELLRQALRQRGADPGAYGL